MGEGVSEPASDEILMAAYQAGNEAAFEALFERHAGSVYGFLARRLPDPSLAEDLYQEAFLRVHRARHTYDSARPFRAWLFGIVHNLLADVLRERVRKGAPETLGADDARPSAREASPAEPSPEAAIDSRRSAEALGAALRALPPDESTVLILARLEGLSYEDIGLVIGRSATATKQLAYRALRRVRERMVEAGHGDET
jgi:RNA polymerase sigma-70 factor (ECF subfamily)